MGKNICQSEHPEVMIQAIHKIVKEGNRGRKHWGFMKRFWGLRASLTYENVPAILWNSGDFYFIKAVL